MMKSQHARKLAIPLTLAVSLPFLFGSSTGLALEREHWHGDIHHFHEHDIRVWRRGRWFHGGHAGHLGWWYIVNGIWYFYPKPVYPYPDPYTPPVNTVVIQPAPMAQPMPAPMPAPRNYFYCQNPHGYYPYVTGCYGGWITVPAGAPPVGAPPPPPAAAAPPGAPGGPPPGTAFPQ